MVTAAVAPVLVDAAVTCPSGGYPVSMTVVDADRTYVAYTGPFGLEETTFITFDGAGQATVEVGPRRASRVQVLADPAGGPHLVGNGTDGNLHFYNGNATGWSPEPIDVSHPAAPGVALAGNALYSPDGRAHVLYLAGLECRGGTPVRLATRAVNGVWTDTAAPSSAWSWARLVVDSRQRLHAVNMETDPSGAGAIVDWQPGSAPRQLANLTAYADWPSATAFGDGEIAVAMPTEAGIHVLVPDQAGVHRDRLLPETESTVVQAHLGQGATSPALAATADGRLWLAYLLHHGTGSERWREVILTKVPPDPASPAAVVWRRRVPGGIAGDDWLALETVGARLTVAFTSYDSWAINYVVLDATGL
jgi:hypothetical protein